MVRPLTTRPAEAPRRPWRDGVESRVHDGASSLFLLEQWSRPGVGAPTHAHPGVEEVVFVVVGAAEFWVDGENERLDEGGSIVVPAGSRHGFRNVGTGELHTLAVFASAQPTVEYDAERGTVLDISERHRREEESP